MPNSYIETGAELTVNTVATNTQFQSDVVALSDGRILVTWTDYSNSNAGPVIKGQLFDANGSAIGGEFLATPQRTFVMWESATAALSDGGFVISWREVSGAAGGDGYSGGIHAQRYDANGVPVGGNFLVNVQTNGDQLRQAVTGLSGGGFVITWTDPSLVGGDSSETAIKGRLYDANGVAVGGEFLVNTITTGGQVDSSITGLSGGGFVVTWADKGVRNSSSQVIYTQAFDASGAKIGGQIAVNTPHASSFGPSVSALTNGGYVVSWFESVVGGDSTYKLQMFDANGAEVGAEIAVDYHGTNWGVIELIAPSLTALADGGFVLAWTENNTNYGDGSKSSINIQVFDAAGVADGPPVAINNQTNGVQEDPSVAALPDGGFVVTWTDRNGDGNDDDEIRAQIFAPVPKVAITSHDGADSVALVLVENGTLSETVAASGSGTSDAIVYTIDGGADAALFTIDAATGALSFVGSPDYEAPADADADNVYEVVVSAHKGSAVDTQALTVTVKDDALTIAGGSVAAVTVAENGTAVTSVQASDPEGAAIGYAITGGADAALFTVDALTGAIEFVSAPDYEAPADADGDNIYDVVVTASTASSSVAQAIAITVGDVVESVVITSGGGSDTTAVSAQENATAAGQVVAASPQGGTVSYSIVGGEDAARFTIDAATGALSFVNAPNFEAPTDADHDNNYRVKVRASDGITSDEQALTITVGNVLEDVAITSDGGAASVVLNRYENKAEVQWVKAVDPDGGPVNFAIAGGADAARFTIDASTGMLSFISAPDFEAPTDADGNNAYEVVVRANDGSSSDTQSLLVVIGNLNEAPVITTGGGGDTAMIAILENKKTIASVKAVDPEGVAVSYAIVGGADAAKFAIDAATGALSFVNAPDYELPSDMGGNNVYDVIVRASDGNLTDVQAIAVSVIDAPDGAVITGNASSNSISTTSTVAGQSYATQYDDSIYGLGGNDTLQGAGGKDLLDGGANNDTLVGGTGADTLIGGTGTDQFIWLATNDSLGSAMDLVTDFNRAEGDRLNLSAMDARTTTAGDQSFTFIGSSTFSHVAGQLRYQISGSNTIVMGDVNGDNVADFQFVISGAISLSSSDFVL